jgi:6-phosphogluconolactonase
MSHSRKRAASEAFVYIGAGQYGQHGVSDSPGYEKGNNTKRRCGILIMQADKKAGPLAEVGFFDSVNIGWIDYNSKNQTLYASSECGAPADDKLHAYKIAPDGTLTELSSESTLGGVAHFEFSPDGKHVLVANYVAAVLAVLPLRPDGTIGPASDSKLHFASPPDPAAVDRQEASHPHQIKFAPGGKFVLSCDLGADKVWVYEFDPVRGSLIGAANSTRHLALPPRSGPRHLAFHPCGSLVYILCELSAEVVVCKWDAEQGMLRVVQSIYALPEGIKPSRAHHSGCSHILVAADGRTVYAATRTDNAIVTFGTSEEDGTLKRHQCGEPRRHQFSTEKIVPDQNLG